VEEHHLTSINVKQFARLIFMTWGIGDAKGGQMLRVLLAPISDCIVKSVIKLVCLTILRVLPKKLMGECG